MRYQWENLQTGGKGESNFTAAQHPFFDDPIGISQRSLEREAVKLIAAWNRQQPAVWHYTLVG